MPSLCAWFPTQVFQPRRYRPGDIGNWSGHLPFAHDLIAEFRPACFVELGTHLGESYFGFCQAIAQNQLPSVAYAIDTWMGEEHAGFYDNNVYEDVSAYNQANYANFSYLLKSLFDDALQQFADDSIDVLHIDGLHTFDAVSHDFYSWLPKVRPGGIILLHDVCVKHRDFGVWKLWDKLKIEGETFEFHHSWGLGVFRKPGGSALDSELLKALFEGGTDLQEQVRRYYSLAATELELKHRDSSVLQQGIAENYPRLQVYLPSNHDYREEHSQTVPVKPGSWQCVTLDLPEGVSAGAVRLDLADRPTIIDLRGIALISAVDQEPLWSSRSGSELSQFRRGGTLMLIPFADSNGACRFFSYGNDPQLYLPSMEPGRFDQPLTLKIWLRLQVELDALALIIDASTKSDPLPADSELVHALKAELNTVMQELEQERFAAAAARSETAAARSELEANQRDRAHLTDDTNKKQTKLYLLDDLRHELKKENEELRDRFINLEKTYLDLRETFSILETAHSELQTAHEDLLRQHQAVDATLTDVLRSRSWRLTAPLRSVTENLKGRSNSGNSN